MNKHSNSTSVAETAITRRTMLAGMALASVPATTIASPKTPSIDDFLAKASNGEKAWYHANALAEIMNEMHPDYSFRSHVDHGSQFCLIVGDKRESGKKVKVHIHDGSPLLADDVTGTTAFADWEGIRA